MKNIYRSPTFRIEQTVIIKIQNSLINGELKQVNLPKFYHCVGNFIKKFKVDQVNELLGSSKCLNKLTTPSFHFTPFTSIQFHSFSFCSILIFGPLEIVKGNNKIFKCRYKEEARYLFEIIIQCIALNIKRRN